MLSIVLTAPTGAVAIAVSGPRLLQQAETRKQKTGDNDQTEALFDDHPTDGLELNAIA